MATAARTLARKSVTGGVWGDCHATPSGSITEDECQRISKIPRDAQRYCDAHDCKCPFRLYGTKKQTGGMNGAGVAKPSGAKKSPDAERFARAHNLMAKAKKALANKTYEELDPGQCRPFPNKHGQPRHEIPESRISSMQASLEQIGQVEACVARRNKKDGMRDIFSGETRWAGASRIKGFVLQVLTVEFDDDELLPFILACAANGNRKDLDPLEMSDAIVRLYNDEGLPMPFIAEKIFDIKPARAERYRRLELLSPEVRQLLATKSITESEAEQVVGLRHSEQMQELRRMQAAKHVGKLGDPIPRGETRRGRPPPKVASRKNPLDRLDAYIKRLGASANGFAALLDEHELTALLREKPGTRERLQHSLADAIRKLEKARVVLKGD